MSKGMQNMHAGRQAALIVFVAVIMIDVIGLILDYLLRACHMPTITDHVRQDPLIGLALIALQCVAAVALALHFWYLEGT